MNIKELFAKLPEPLQRQLIILTVSCGAFLVAFAVVTLSFWNLYLGLSLLLLSLGVAAYTIWLTRRLLTGKYVAVSGICCKVARPRFKHSGILLYFSAGECIIKLRCKQRMKELGPGDTITMYILEETPVYEGEGCLIPGAYLTIDYRKGRMTHE